MMEKRNFGALLPKRSGWSGRRPGRASLIFCAGLTLALPRAGWAQEADAQAAEEGRSDAGAPSRDEEPMTAPATTALDEPAESSSAGTDGEAAGVAEELGTPPAPETSPAETSPAETSPTETSPTETSPAETSPAETSPAMAADETSAGPSPQRITAIALTGLAFVGVAVGTSYAIRAVSRDRQAEAECSPVCTAAGDRLQRQSNKAATVAQIAFAVGLVSVGGAAYAWIKDSSEPEAAPPPVASPAWSFDVVAAPGEAAAWLGGSF